MIESSTFGRGGNLTATTGTLLSPARKGKKIVFFKKAITFCTLDDSVHHIREWTACRHVDSNPYIPLSKKNQSSMGCQRIFKKGGGKETQTHTPHFPQKSWWETSISLMAFERRGGGCRPPTSSSFSHKMEKKFFWCLPPSLPPLVFQKGFPPPSSAKGRQAWGPAKKVPMEYS